MEYQCQGGLFQVIDEGEGQAMNGLEEYRRKLKNGEIKAKPRLSPLERHQRYPKSRKYAILAKCYECMAEYVDGRKDCGITSCPLYAWMPYREKD